MQVDCGEVFAVLDQYTEAMVAGVLIGVIGIGGILVIDIVTFVVAILALFVILIPQPEQSAAGKESQGSIWQGI